MKKIVFLLILQGFLALSCSERSSKDDITLVYLESILKKPPLISQRYIIVSDYSCLPCREAIYQEIEDKSFQDVYIILGLRNKAVLEDRFHETILEKRFYLDSLEINKKIGFFVSKAIRVYHDGDGWVNEQIE
jgi:hypothetical protein